MIRLCMCQVLINEVVYTYEYKCCRNHTKLINEKNYSYIQSIDLPLHVMNTSSRTQRRSILATVASNRHVIFFFFLSQVTEFLAVVIIWQHIRLAQLEAFAVVACERYESRLMCVYTYWDYYWPLEGIKCFFFFFCP